MGGGSGKIQKKIFENKYRETPRAGCGGQMMITARCSSGWTLPLDAASLKEKKNVLREPFASWTALVVWSLDGVRDAILAVVLV